MGLGVACDNRRGTWTHMASGLRQASRYTSPFLCLWMVTTNFFFLFSFSSSCNPSASLLVFQQVDVVLFLVFLSFCAARIFMILPSISFSFFCRWYMLAAVISILAFVKSHILLSQFVISCHCSTCGKCPYLNWNNTIIQALLVEGSVVAQRHIDLPEASVYRIPRSSFDVGIEFHVSTLAW